MSIASKLRKLKNANYRETDPLQLPDGMMVIISSLDGAADRTIADYLISHVGKSLGHYTKLESLAHSICWIQTSDGEVIDLRGVTHIETDELLGNGTPVKVQRHIFMREIVNSWPDIVVDTLFAKYAQLMEDIDESLNKTIKVEFGDTPLLMKINTLSDDLRDLVRDAQARGLDVDAEIAQCFGNSVMNPETGDALLRALKEKSVHVPEPVHPFDEQLTREREENPDVYPVRQDSDVVDEVPQSIRR